MTTDRRGNARLWLLVLCTALLGCSGKSGSTVPTVWWPHGVPANEVQVHVLPPGETEWQPFAVTNWDGNFLIRNVELGVRFRAVWGEGLAENMPNGGQVLPVQDPPGLSWRSGERSRDEVLTDGLVLAPIEDDPGNALYVRGTVRFSDGSPIPDGSLVYAETPPNRGETNYFPVHARTGEFLIPHTGFTHYGFRNRVLPAEGLQLRVQLMGSDASWVEQVPLPSGIPGVTGLRILIPRRAPYDGTGPDKRAVVVLARDSASGEPVQDFVTTLISDVAGQSLGEGIRRQPSVAGSCTFQLPCEWLQASVSGLVRASGYLEASFDLDTAAAASPITIELEPAVAQIIARFPRGEALESPFWALHIWSDSGDFRDVEFSSGEDLEFSLPKQGTYLLTSEGEAENASAPERPLPPRFWKAISVQAGDRTLVQVTESRPIEVRGRVDPHGSSDGWRVFAHDLRSGCLVADTRADGHGAFRLLLPDWNRKVVLIASSRVEADGFLTLQFAQLDQTFAPTAPPTHLVLRGRNTILTLPGPELDLNADSFLLVWDEGSAGAAGDWIIRHGGSYWVQESAVSTGQVIGLPPGRFLFGSEYGQTREAITLTFEDGSEDLAAVLREAGIAD